MKKRCLILCLVGVLLFSACAFVSCDETHTHTYHTHWRKNPTHHWHACQEDGCEATLEKGEHIWNVGTVVVPATRDAKGEIDYTCTVCGYTKREVLEYNAVNTVDGETAWLAAFSLLENCEIRATRNLYYVKDGARGDLARGNQRIEEIFTSADGFRRVSDKKDSIYVRDGKNITKYEINYEAESPVWTIEQAASIPSLADGGESVPLMQTKDMFSSFTYDPQTRYYVAENVRYFSPIDSKYVTVERAYIGFENGMIDRYIYCLKGVDSKGTPYEQEVILRVGSYGTVQIIPPTAS